MKYYAVEIKRTAYYTIHIEAKNKDEAITLAWEEVASDIEPDGDADWEVNDIYEEFATDETRSSGERGQE